MLRDLYCSLDITRVVKTNRMRLFGNVGERNAFRFRLRILNNEDHFEILMIDGLCVCVCVCVCCGWGVGEGWYFGCIWTDILGGFWPHSLGSWIGRKCPPWLAEELTFAVCTFVLGFGLSLYSDVVCRNGMCIVVWVCVLWVELAQDRVQWWCWYWQCWTFVFCYQRVS